MDDLRRDRTEDQSFEAAQSAGTHDDFSAMPLPRNLDNRLRRITHPDECLCVYMIFRQDGRSTFQILFAFCVMMLLDHGTSYKKTRREGHCPLLAADALMTAAQAQFKPIPATAPALPGNPATPAKLLLGKMLFFDPRLSASHAISCNSCHNIGLGGVDDQETSIGHHWQRGGRNSPTVFNAVFNTAQFWDGRAQDLEAQAVGPMVNPVEMASPTAHVAEQLSATPGYVTAFQFAFPGVSGPMTLENAQRAIAVFEATLITPNAPFDKYRKGNAAALYDTQKSGLKLFTDKGCAACHNGINIGGGRYAPFGVVEKPGAAFLPPDDKGRFMVTKTASDEYVFRVPTLRNIALTAPYFHTGKAWDLRQAVAVMGTSQLGANLSEDEIDRITSFLGSLTGDIPSIVYPALPPGVASTPHPEP